MTITSRDIVEILKTARELGYKEFRLELEGLQLSASSEARASDRGVPASLAGSPPPALTLPVSSPGAPAASPAAPVASPSMASTGAAQAPREGLVVVSAPMSGTFYRSPAPGEPPFVEVGSRVEAGDVICIIEVMKLFNSIRAGTAGVITEIAVGNEGAVVAGQPVIWIKPSDA